jgi:putative redox protein
MWSVAHCETKEGRLGEITREITMGATSTTRRQRLLEIADMCPVHRTLASEIKIRTRLAASPMAGSQGCTPAHQ